MGSGRVLRKKVEISLFPNSQGGFRFQPQLSDPFLLTFLVFNCITINY